jgi:Rad3-related DNA helicase
MFLFAGNGIAGVLPKARTHFPGFPYDPPYPIQQDFMAAVYSRLQSGGIGLFESPTGKHRFPIPSLTIVPWLVHGTCASIIAGGCEVLC